MMEATKGNPLTDSLLSQDNRAFEPKGSQTVQIEEPNFSVS